VPTVVWTGGTNSNWSNDGNWSGGAKPTSSQVALFNSGSVNCTIDSSVNVGGIAVTSGYSGSITQAAGQTITVGSSGWSQAARTFTGGNSAIDINGPFSLSGGTFTASSGAMTVSGNFTLASGVTFTKGGTLTFDGDLTVTDNTDPKQNLGNVTFQ
jgi:hypothetical protein